MSAQCLAQLCGIERSVRIVRMMHRPLQLNALQLGRTVLEAHHFDVALGCHTGADRGRRRGTTRLRHVIEPNRGPGHGQPTAGYPSMTDGAVRWPPDTVSDS